ncbi:MAG TPA: DNRLRE domain-containing protein [Acidimicrobiales bacterium]
MTAAVVLTGAIAVHGPRVGAAPRSAEGTAALAQPEPLDADRDQEAMREAVEEAENTIEAERQANEVALPPGSLDGTAGPDLFTGEDPSILRPLGLAGAVRPPRGGPASVEAEIVADPDATGGLDAADLTALDTPELPVDELTEAVRATSQSLVDGGDPGELVQRARGLDLSTLRVGEEVEQLRTPDSRTFLNADGTFRTELGSEPMFARDSLTGELVEPDATLLGRRDGRWRPTAARQGVSFGATARDAALGSMSFTGGRSLSWRLTGAAPVAGTRHDDTVVYEGVFDDVDVEMETTVTGVKETIVIHDARSPTVYEFSLDLDGLEPELDDPYGSVVLRDTASGEPVGVIPSAWAEDAGRGPRGETPDPGPVAYELVGSGAETLLRVSVDEAWLRDPARVFPVRVDPTVGDYRMSGDTWIHSRYPTTNRSTSPILKSGGGGGNRRTYFARWDVGWLVAATILDAEYKTLNSYSYSCSPRWFGVYRVTSNWNPATVTWGSQPSYSGLLGAHNKSHGYSGSCPAAWMDNPMRGTVQGWVDAAYPAYGVTGRVAANDSYDDDYSYKEFLSREAGGSGGQILQIVWSPWRVRYAVASTLTTPTATTAGSIKIKVTNKAPTTWNATGSNRYRLGYHVYASNGTTLINWEGGRVDLPKNVGWGQSATITVPLAAMPVGDYQIKFDMLQTGVRWFSQEGSHPDLTPMSVRVSVGNTPPYIQSASPAGMSETRTPTLTVIGKNPDAYPSGGLEYRFTICEDEAMTSGCVQSAWSTSREWTPGHLQWATPYFWNAAVRETGSGALTTHPDWKAPLTPTIVQPRLERHFGSDDYAPLHGGVNPSIGNYVGSFNDVLVAAAGLPVELTRTYNSMDTRVGAFGQGWSTFLDLSAEEEDGETLLVSFPDGRKERYGENADGSWAAPAGNASVLRNRSGGGWELERPDRSVYEFDAAGLPVAIRDGWGHALTLQRNTSTGLVERVTNQPSGRHVDLEWDGLGPDGASVVVAARTNPTTSGGTSPEWAYGYSGGRLVEVCAPGEPEPDAACTGYAYYASGRGAEGKLRSITRQEGNVAVELDYRSNGAVAWVENGTDDRWTFTDADDQAEGTYHPISGWRAAQELLVTKTGTVTVDLTGGGAVPEDGVQAVVVDIMTASYGGGWLSVYPSGTTEPPGVSTMTYPGGYRSTLHTVAVGDDGKVKLTNHGSMDALVTFDVVGWYAEAGTPGGSVFVPLPTKRVLDTRVSGQGPALGANEARSLQITGVGGVPEEGVRAVVFDLEMVGASATTELTSYPSGTPRPPITTGLSAGTVDNLQITAVGDDGKIVIHNSTTSVHILVDIVGYFADPDLHEGNVFRPVTNHRLLDTRKTEGQWTTPWPEGGKRPVAVPAQGPIPGRGVTAVVGEVQALQPSITHWMRTTPSGTEGAGTTYLAQKDQNLGNHLYVGLGDSGTFDLTSEKATDVIVDVFGYFTPIPRTTYVEDPRGNTAEYRYDELGRQVSRIDEEGHATAYAYNDEGFLASTRDERGEGHVYTYDDEGHLLTDKLVRYYGGEESQIRDWESTTYFGYVDDPANPARDGKLAWVADGRSADAEDLAYRTAYEYDVNGQPLTVRGPALANAPDGVGVTSTYADGTTKPAACAEVGPPGLLQTETDARGLTTTYCYDAKGDLGAVHHPSGLVDQYTYDGLGRTVAHTAVSDTYPAGVTTTRDYDSKGRLIAEAGPRVTSVVTDPTTGSHHRAETITTYTPNGNVDRVTVTDTETTTSRWVEFAYDLADRVTNTLDNAGRTTAQTYDPNGNVATRTGMDGTTIKHSYDLRNLPTQEQALDVVDDPIGEPGVTRDVRLASRRYDAKGRVSVETDAAGRSVVFRWSPDGQIEHRSVRHHRDTDPATGLPAGSPRTVLIAGAQMDRAGNAIRGFAPSDVAIVDEFDGTTLANPWQSEGTWTVAGGELSSAGSSKAWRPGAADGQIGLTVGSSDTLSVMFRVEDAANYMELTWDDTLLVANQVVGGLANDFEGNLAAALGTGDRVEVNFVGNRLRVFRNGSMVMETTIPADTPGTGVGVVAAGAGQSADRFRFDAYRRTETSVDAYGRAVSETVDPGGADIRTEWALLPDGRPSAVLQANASDPTAVASTTYGYDPQSGHLVWEEALIDDPDSEVLGDEVVARTEYGYDQRGLRTSSVSPEGARTDYAYDEAGQLTQVTGPARTVERHGTNPQPDVRPTDRYGYTAFGELSEIEDAAGNKTVITVDERGFPIETALPSYTPPGGSPVHPTVTTQFDDIGRTVSQTDPAGETTAVTYNTLGHQVAVQQPAVGTDPPGVTRFVYDDVGRLLERTGPTGAVTRQRWDDLGRVTAIEDVVRQPDLASHLTAMVVGDGGGVLNTRSAEGVVESTTYDRAGRIVRTADADGNATTYAYDGLGRLERVIAPDGRAVRTAYDLVGNTIAEQTYGPDGTTLLGESRYGWNKDSQVISAASPRGVAEGFATGYGYDAVGQLTERTTAVAPGQAISETWGYDELGNATRYTDGRGNTTWQTYNSMGLPEDAIEPAAGPHTALGDRRWRTVYDPAGRPTAQQAPGGVLVTSRYDELGRLVEQAGAGAQAATATRTFTYDPAGRLLSASSGTGSQTFNYDDRGLLLSSDGAAGASSFAYDGDGRKTSRIDSSGATSISYDNRGLPEIMTSSLSGTASFDFDESGRLTGLGFGDGTSRSYTYDDWGRLDTDRLMTGTTELYGVDYGYDLDGNVTSKEVSGVDVPAGGLNQYSYDWASRLTAWTGPAGIGEDYAWDAASNRTQAGATTATFDEQNRLVRTAGPQGLMTNTWLANGTLDQQKVQRRVAIVVADPNALSPADATLVWDFAATGHNWVVIDDGDPAPTADVDVVVISPSVDPATIADKYAAVDIPVVNLAAGTWQASGLTDAAPNDSVSDSATVVAPEHPAAAGKTGTVTLLSSADSMSAVALENLGAGATAVWAAGSASDVTVATYDQGDATFSGTAPERRIIIGFSAGAVAKINANGWALILAAAEWADDNDTVLGTTNFDFDAFEQLSKITTPDGTAGEHVYDGLGRRLTSPTGDLTYAGMDIRASADGAFRYQRGPAGAIGIDDLADGGGLWAYADNHTDVVGSFTPGATSLTGAQAFTPWGQPLAARGDPLPLGYQSERQDLPGGLVGMGVREYNPATGTFISHDPVVDPAVPNGYSYTPANPLGHTDPTGTQAPPIALPAGAAGVATACTGPQAAACAAGATVGGVVLICVAYCGDICIFGHGPGCGGSSSGAGSASSALLSYYRDLLDMARSNSAASARAQAEACRRYGYCGDWGDSHRDPWGRRELGGRGSSTRGGGSGAGSGAGPLGPPPPKPIWTDPALILNPPAYADSALAALVASTGSAVPDYPGRFQDGIDTGISSRATTPVAVVVAHADPAPVVPEIILNLASDIFELGAITTPRPPVPPTSDLERAADAGMCGYDIGQTIGGNSDWLSTFIGCISAASSFSSSTAAPNAPGTHGGVPAPRRSACSFDGETEVVMADGSTKPIEDVEVGDRVVATDPETGESGSRRVTHVWVHDDTVVDLEVDGEVVTTTEDHQFWNDTDGEWQASEDLDPDDRLLTADGDTITVDGLDWSTAETTAAYNLTVDDLHTYYIAVGDESALVHNDGCGPRPAPQLSSGVIDPSEVRFTQDSIRQTFRDGRTVSDLARGLRTGTVDPSDVPPIRLVEYKGRLFTLDNRRLAAFGEAGISAPYRMATPREIAREWKSKFTTDTEGQSIQLRLF